MSCGCSQWRRRFIKTASNAAIGLEKWRLVLRIDFRSLLHTHGWDSKYPPPVVTKKEKLEVRCRLCHKLYVVGNGTNTIRPHFMISIKRKEPMSIAMTWRLLKQQQRHKWMGLLFMWDIAHQKVWNQSLERKKQNRMPAKSVPIVFVPLSAVQHTGFINVSQNENPSQN